MCNQQLQLHFAHLKIFMGILKATQRGTLSPSQYSSALKVRTSGPSCIQNVTGFPCRTLALQSSPCLTTISLTSKLSPSPAACLTSASRTLDFPLLWLPTTAICGRSSLRSGDSCRGSGRLVVGWWQLQASRRRCGTCTAVQGARRGAEQQLPPG